MGACRWKIIIPSLFGTQGLPSFSTCALLKTVSMRSYLYARNQIWQLSHSCRDIYLKTMNTKCGFPPIICIHLHDCASMQTNPVTWVCCRAHGHSKRWGAGGGGAAGKLCVLTDNERSLDKKTWVIRCLLAKSHHVIMAHDRKQVPT